MATPSASPSLEGRVLAIAGAGGNLGPTVVRRLARVTGHLCLCGRDRSSLEPLAAESPDTIDTDELDLLDAAATKAWADELVERHGRVDGRGRFVIVSTGQAQAPTHTNAAYAAAKAAAEAWTLALADRFKGSGATANIVVVGAIVTPEMREESPDKDFSTSTPAEEIAEAIAYLCSDAASSMNGQRLTLRGAA